MFPSRASANDLARLLDAVAEPVWVLDDERRIIFYNRACGEWTGCGALELVGQECRYHSTGDAAGAPALAAALCPPPAVLAGKRASATVALPGRDATLSERQVDFVPLGGDGGRVLGVMALAGPAGAAAPAAVAAGEPSAAELHARIERYRREMKARFHIDRLLGDSPAMKRVRAQVLLASTSTASVLVVGPAGSGRQHVARAIHYSASSAPWGPIVPLACSLLGPEMLQATLQGLTRPPPGGAAHAPASLLLNDAECLLPDGQSQLATFLLAVDLAWRVISTAREPLAALAARGSFRHDLACLLSTVTIQLPPLAERLDDLPLLAQCFLEQANARGAKQLGGFTPQALDRLAAYDWPGQLSELEEVVAEAHGRAQGAEVAPADLPPRIHLAAGAAARPRRPDETMVLEEFLGKIEEELIRRALQRARGNKTKAARLLGMTRPRLYRRLVQLGLEERPPE